MITYQSILETFETHKLLVGNDLDAFKSSVGLTSQQINDLPLILCGPILRNVKADSVSVWFVLKQAITSVVLEVYDEENGLIVSEISPILK
jgi:hypothetical protein